jgi:uncharacterized protein with PIN domain
MREGYIQRLARLLTASRGSRGKAIAERLVSRGGTGPSGSALAGLYRRVRNHLEERGQGPAPAFDLGRGEPLFVCDGSLGGLARWLRSAGYRSRYARGRSGRSLVESVKASGEVLLSSDSRLVGRADVRTGALRALWIPVDLPPAEQLRLVIEDLDLPLLPPRCMSCGGEQRPVTKAEVADRIPPRTARWLDDYFLCRDCDALYWRGTHWQRIEARLPRRVVP